MEKWSIGKQFDFCYGHRVWSQDLIEGYSEDTCLACRHLHGHQGKIIVHLESINKEQGLTKGMVTDFKHLGWFKKWVDDTLDHKFIMDLKDPLFDHEVPGRGLMYILKPIGGDNYHFANYWIVDPTSYNHPEFKKLPSLKEKYEGMLFVEFVPTSENLSRWLCTIVNYKMNKIGIKCTHIEFFETPKSQSNYYS